MKRILILILVLVTVNQLYARLGETEEQIEGRYGKAVQTAPSNIESINEGVYEKNGYKIIVSFLNGKSCCEFFFHVPHRRFTKSEFQSLLDINTLGSKWLLIANNGNELDACWQLANKGATAFINHIYMQISTKEYNLRFHESKTNDTQGF